MTAQDRPARKLLQRLLYPFTLLAALGAMALAIRFGVPLAVAPYLAVIVGAALILWGERTIPYRPAWRPSGRDIVDDGLFMAAVQVLLPLGLSWLAVYLVQRLTAGAGLTLHWWPAAWPLWAQVLLKIAAGDLLRYWLHRASHETKLLWRLHAVHHAPEKLYALNVFRFHPADKALQFLLDSLPFILLGAGPEVFAWYFVVYAVAGLYQHSNVDLKLGVFNYLVVGPELHRWHHSRRIIESNANYAHTFALWDVLFGTWRMPKDRQPEDLGLLDPAYPRGFLGQMAAPLWKSGSKP
ncbi:MAG: hypothetical protein BGN86_16835 [Caulobacterales bacterium 68-7]|nr:MAG: hypothetical protein BGN86_16835 [Caulobacterales bacterium 68-7]